MDIKNIKKLPTFHDELTAELILLRNRDKKDSVYESLQLFLNGYKYIKKALKRERLHAWEEIKNRRQK